MNQKSQSMGEYLSSPVTSSDRIKAGVLGLILLALGAAMIVWPSLVDGLGEAGQDASRARTRNIVALVDFLWDRPTGIVLALLGLLMSYSAIKQPKDEPQAPAA